MKLYVFGLTLFFTGIQSLFAGEVHHRFSLIETVSMGRSYPGTTIERDMNNDKVKSCLAALHGENPSYEFDCTRRYGQFIQIWNVVNSLTGGNVSCSLECFSNSVSVGQCRIEKYQGAQHPEDLRLQLISNDKNGWITYKKLEIGTDEISTLSSLIEAASSCKYAPYCFPEAKCSEDSQK